MPVRIVSPATAAKLLASPKIVSVDSTWYMPNSPHNAIEQYSSEDRIKSAVFFDLDQVCSPSKFPHMLPSHGVFCKATRELGIEKSQPVLVYDRSGIFSGPRAAWTFTLNGHENVFLLDHYRSFKEQNEVETGKIAGKPQKSDYDGISESVYDENYRNQVIEFEELEKLVKSGELTSKYYVFDARSTGRFTGQDPEPRPGLSSGHVPGSFSLPFSKVLDSDGHYKSRDELVELFKKEFRLDLTQPLGKDVIVMCGTGVTAVILKLAIERVSESIKVRVYDGSWTEWAQRAPGLIEKA